MGEIIDKYKSLIEKYVDIEILSLEEDDAKTNKFIKFICQPGAYRETLVFMKRIERLHHSYNSNIHNWKAITNALGQLSKGETATWIGAYSEIVGYDFLIRDSYFTRSFTTKPPELNKDIDSKYTLGGKPGGLSNLDIYFECPEVYMDIKAYWHILPDVINEVVEKAKKVIGHLEDLVVGLEYFMDHNNEELKKDKSNIYTKVEAALREKKSDLILQEHELKLVFKYDRRIHFFVSEYDHYKAAARNHRMIFKHFKKFHLNRPFFIVYVVSPLFSGPYATNIDSQKEFYRSFSRRVFTQYKGDLKKVKDRQGVETEQTYWESSKYLTGIIFIEDKFGSHDYTDSSFGAVYLNPNATNSLGDTYEFGLLRGEGIADVFDDFKHDNY